MQFQLNDTVTWSSNGGGGRVTKMGYVAEIVKTLRLPQNPNRRKWRGGPRDHVSYVIAANGQFYWPVVSLLTKV